MQRLTDQQRLQIVRQVGGLRHRRVVYEDRNHALALPQRFGHFETHEIALVVEPPPASLARHGEPLRPDQYQHHVGEPDVLAQCCSEILAERNVVDIHEHAVGAERQAQPIVQATGVRGAVLAAITDEDAARWRYSRSCYA